MELTIQVLSKCSNDFAFSLGVIPGGQWREALKKSQPHDLDVHYKLEGALYGLSVAQQDNGDTESGDKLMQRVDDLRRQSAELEQDNVTNEIRLLLALARAGEVEDGVKLAGKLSESIGEDDVNRYDLACGYAQLARARAAMGEGTKSAGLPSEETLVDAALDTLEDALKHGFSRSADLKMDPELAPLRELSEFAALVKG